MPESSVRLNVVSLLNASHIPQGLGDSLVELYGNFISKLHPSPQLISVANETA